MHESDAYDELAAYSLVHGDEAFLHQVVVDTWAVQTAGPDDPPIRAAQALVGLYLHVEHRVSGRNVQRVHMLLANRRPAWPAFSLPPRRGRSTVDDVLAAPAGADRDEAIERWAASTWAACRSLAPQVEAFLAEHGITPPSGRRATP